MLRAETLSFPSASAIEYLDNKLYVFGDDAPCLLVLSTDYRPLDSICFWPQQTTRISKEDKPDIESALIFQREGRQYVAGLGSLSTQNRWNTIEFSPALGTIGSAKCFTPSTFSGIKALNIEGSCTVGPTLVLANRANLGHPENHLVFYDSSKPVVVKKIVLPQTKSVAGVSGLYYLAENDLLLFTASEEETTSTTSDGAIGDSYLGGIEQFSRKTGQKDFRPDFFWKLSTCDKRFAGQKIESVCVEKSEGKTLLVHLVADNDDGRSSLFKLQVILP